MPAFINNGPDIPESLLQLHEDGRVVFFCGAGISYPAGLPGFGGLVKKIYDRVGVFPNAVQVAAIKDGRYDTAIGLLEAEIVGGREAVRHAILHILTPTISGPKATATHDALLTLARNRKGRMRLVTTNFDCIFEKVIIDRGLEVECFKAPLFPIPKNRWDGLVYLHGLLPSAPKSAELDRLVVSSGDFGLAYLTERWAARFVSELFRNYSVCFVGYSIDDPVLRYMMDALAADRSFGESLPDAYAFCSFSKGKEDKTADEWKAKNVIPILYRKHRNHTYLHRTLREWAKIYRDGVRGKEMIIAHHAINPPLAPSKIDYAVGRVLWALTDGLAAKHFADLNPVPPLKWLEPLSESQFEHHDLIRFGVNPDSTEDKTLKFSLIRRPAPYKLSPLMCLVDWEKRGSDLDDVMYHLARWLTRHLNDPELILWLSKNGCYLHDVFRRLIDSKIRELLKQQNDGKKEELDRILSAAPNALPSPLMRILWRILLSGRLSSIARRADLYDWFSRIKTDGVTPSLRMELRKFLSPCVTFRSPFKWEESETKEPERIKDLVDWELKLSAEHVHNALRDREKTKEWNRALPYLLPDFTLLLRDTLELMMELGEVSEIRDSSYIHQPSISDHPQNRNFHDWTALIILNRDAWLETVQVDISRARVVAGEWWRITFPLFKRLALFAATQDGVINQRQALDWLLEVDGWWLWSVETQREVSRLLVYLAPKLTRSELTELEQIILIGPPRKMFREDLDQEEFNHVVDKDIFLYLVKIETAGAALGKNASSKLFELKKRFPDWKSSPEEKEEFPFWMSDGKEGHKFTNTPRRRRDLVEWIKENPSSDHWKEDDWRQRCSKEFPTTACTLCALVKEEFWPKDRWREALQAWSEEHLLKRSWRHMHSVLCQAPLDIFKSLEHGISWWLQSIAKEFEGHEEVFFNLCRRILEISSDNEKTDDPVGHAINHPIGLVTEALLRWWYRSSPKDGEGLQSEIKAIFTKLCNTQITKFRNGRILIATHAIPLYRVDREWTLEFLLPLFDWQISEVEARSAWRGFLWSPRLIRPFLFDIKVALLETASHCDELGSHADTYAEFLTFAALDPGDTFTREELAETTKKLPLHNLQSVASALARAFEGAKGQRNEYWKNRLLPYFQKIWPKSKDLFTQQISESFARLCVVAGDAFPDVYQYLKNWLMPLRHPDYIIHLLHETTLCKEFPVDALSFLYQIVGNDAKWLPIELQLCLDEIRNGNSELADDETFIRLSDLIRKHGE